MKNEKENSRKQDGFLWIALGLLLIAAALFLASYNLYEDQKAASQSQQVLLELLEEMRNLPTEDEADTSEESTEPELVYPDYVLNPYMDMPTVEVEGNDFIGVLAIPDLELEVPVMSQWSYPHLKIAPCRYSGSAYLDDMVIAAHNYTRHFGRLKELSGGETVTFTDVDGNVFTYEVALVETLMPTEVEEMESGDWNLTLFTCTIGGSYRVTVRCDRITEP